MAAKHSRDAILAEATQLTLEEGLAKLTFGRVAKRLGIPDRTVVYYFPTKGQLREAVLGAAFGHFQGILGTAFDQPAESAAALVGRAWKVVANETADPLFRLFFESVGMAMHDAELATTVEGLINAWITSLEPLIAGSPDERRARAEAAVALLDGLVLMRHLAGAEAASRAAEQLLD
ncbi:MAG: TetR/AcrR family transcriptional regulator [Myxococcota bacterium]